MRRPAPRAVVELVGKESEEALVLEADQGVWVGRGSFGGLEKHCSRRQLCLTFSPAAASIEARPHPSAPNPSFVRLTGQVHWQRLLPTQVVALHHGDLIRLVAKAPVLRVSMSGIRNVTYRKRDRAHDQLTCQYGLSCIKMDDVVHMRLYDHSDVVPTGSVRSASK